MAADTPGFFAALRPIGSARLIGGRKGARGLYGLPWGFLAGLPFAWSQSDLIRYGPAVIIAAIACAREACRKLRPPGQHSGGRCDDTEMASRRDLSPSSKQAFTPR